MEHLSHSSARLRKSVAKAVSFLKAKAVMIVCVVMLIVSITYLSYRAMRVAVAIDVWLDLKAHSAGSDAVEKALHKVNNAELDAIPPILLTMVSSAAAFRLVDLKIVPRQCFQCGRWIDAKKAKRSPDRLFYYHEECDLCLKQPTR